LEEAFRGKRFKDFPTSLWSNNDLLTLTHSEGIKTIHAKYVEAGADILETNTFSGTTIAMADYQLKDFVCGLNYQSIKFPKKLLLYVLRKSLMNRGLSQVLLVYQ
jgi:5-methyltetrahydrofolate--homocysteine methyltransferase